jgi:AraC-like DNA-binding protein
MLLSRNEILSQFTSPVYTPHPVFQGMETFAGLSQWSGRGKHKIEVPRFTIEIHSIDYIRNPSHDWPNNAPALRFQQNYYRLWYQVDGQGILNNATRATFGQAKPGLLGVMELGERYNYLHQKGPFECFVFDFSLSPSAQAKCYWNSEVEGKLILQENDRIHFENLIFDLISAIVNDKEILGLASLSRLLEILSVPFQKGLLVISESMFPKNKPKSLIEKARQFMKLHFAEMHDQRGLEKECGVDINYLNVLFTKEMGKTLYKYLTDIRMEHAKYLLEEKKLPIVEIALRVGYPNGNSFSRAFGKYARQSPSSYRRKTANENDQFTAGAHCNVPLQ